MVEARRGELELEQPTKAGAERAFDSAVGILQAHLMDLCASAAGVCVTDYESDADASVASLVDRTGGLLSSALEALDVATILYADVEEPADPFDTSASDADPSESPSAAPQGLADAVVLARMGLRSRQRNLRAIGPGAACWEQLAAIDSALRTIQKSLSGVDRALALAERVPVSVRFYENAVERSLEVRRRYVRLHRAVVQQGRPASADLRARLRLSGNAIAHVLGLQIAVHLRPGDRALLTMSHAKVRDWLSRADDSAAHVAAGLRLWQDLFNVATMFLDVSKREELVQHDARLVREALAALPLADAPWDETARATWLARLTTMAGRSASLDALLEGARPPAPEDLRRALGELDRALAPRGDPGEEDPPRSRPSVL